MRFISGITLLVFFSLIFNRSISQTYSSGITVNMSGYIINLGGKIIFQPCDDSLKTIWQCLDNRSFSLWYFREDLYFEAIENIGEPVLVRYFDNDDNKEYTADLRFFYCRLEVDLMFLDTANFELFPVPKFKLLCNKKEYPLESFRVDNRVMKIIPVRRNDLETMYNFYNDQGFNIPRWLMEEFDQKSLIKNDK